MYSTGEKLSTTDRPQQISHQATISVQQLVKAPCSADEHLLATHGKTFHLASYFLPSSCRKHVITLYTFFRTLDDLVDEPFAGQSTEEVRGELHAWRHWFQEGLTSSAPREPLGSQLSVLVRQHHIPITVFIDFLDGMKSDLEKREIHTFAEMYRYCYCVAGTVGLAMTYILDVRSPAALLAAEQLGVAMQLTNILRDIQEDFLHDRIYLPQDELCHFGCERHHLFKLIYEDRKPDDKFRTLMRYQIQRARGYYAWGLSGIWLLPKGCRLPILLAGRLYRRILNVIEDRQYDVFHSRASTKFPVKVQETVIAVMLDLLWRYGEIQEPTQNGVLS